MTIFRNPCKIYAYKRVIRSGRKGSEEKKGFLFFEGKKKNFKNYKIQSSERPKKNNSKKQTRV
jgi:hypothetical protein